MAQKFESGDIVIDLYMPGSPREGTVKDVKKSRFNNHYKVRHNDGGEHWRTNSDLILKERQEATVFAVKAKYDLDLYGVHIPAGVECAAKKVTPRKYRIMWGGKEVAISEETFEHNFTDISGRPQELNIDKAMRREWPWQKVVVRERVRIGGRYFEAGAPFQLRKIDGMKVEIQLRNGNVAVVDLAYAARVFKVAKEETDMGDGKILPWTTDKEVLRKLEEAAKKEQEEASWDSHIAEAVARAEEKERIKAAHMNDEAERLKSKVIQMEERLREYEQERQQRVAEEFGEVTKTHLWEVEYYVPMRWTGPIPKRGGYFNSEVVTEGRNMVEAAMAAEAIAKKGSAEGHVTNIKYVRDISALK